MATHASPAWATVKEHIPLAVKQIMTDSSISRNTTLSIGFAFALALAAFQSGQIFQQFNTRLSNLEEWQRTQRLAFEQNQEQKKQESIAIVNTIEELRKEIAMISRKAPQQAKQ